MTQPPSTLAKVESKLLHCLMFLAAILAGLVASSTNVTSILGVIQKWLPGGQTTAVVVSAVLLLLTKAPVLLSTVKAWIAALKNAGASVFVLVFATAMLLGGAAQAQTLTPSDVAPPLSFCFGASTTCVVPDSGLQAVNYDLVNKKWSGGITGAGIGYALLFAADTAYASGASVHVTFDFSQSVPSYLAPTFAIVLAHIFELGYTPVFFDGHIGQQITLMIGANAEAIMTAYTGKRLGERLAAKKAEQAASAGAK